MQPTNVLDIERSGDLGGHKVAMKIDENSIAHIMSVLTDLYSDPEMAIIREYSTNGRDAQIEAGFTGPIKVYTPSNLSPFFRVIDRGIGLDLEGIEKIYSQYGASTKRGTNEQTGMLGLGCKSALTYTNQFTLIAIKDGIKTSVMVSRVEDGTGVMEVLFQKPTDEPNGVEVVIPVRFSTTFENKVRNFFQYWEKGTVLVNDRMPEFLNGTGKRLGNSDIYMVPGEGKDVIVMGGVPYPVDGGLAGQYGGNYKKFHVVAFVEIGSVNFPPSREALHYTQRTNRTIETVRAQFQNLIRSTIQDDIAKAETHAKAVESYFQWQAMVPRLGEDYSYNGQRLELQYKVTHHSWDVNATRYAMSHDEANVGYKAVKGALTIVGFDFEKVTTTQRKKVQRWMEEKDEHFRLVLFTEKQIGLPWTEGSRVVHYDEIKALRLPATRNHTKRVAKYDVVVKDGGYTQETDEIDDSQNIYYFSPKEYGSRLHVLRQLFPNDVLVKISSNRHAKFMRDFPNAKPMTVALMQKRMSEVYAMLSNEDKMYLGTDSWTRRIVSNGVLDADRFDDPEIKAYIKACRIKPSGNLTVFEQTKGALQNMGFYSLPEMNPPKIDSPFVNYPLATRPHELRGDMVEHVYVYCNAIYNSKKKEN